MPSPNGAERGESVTLINGITAVGKRTASIPFLFFFKFFFSSYLFVGRRAQIVTDQHLVLRSCCCGLQGPSVVKML